MHKGFNGVFSEDLYDKILNDIKPLLQRTMDDGQLYYNNTLYIGGHSKGGANAQLIAVYYAFFQEDIKTHLVTIGSPAAGNYAFKIFAESLPNLSIWRLVYCRDVVARIPIFNYYQVGHLLWKRCNPPTRYYTLSNDVVEAYYRHYGDIEKGYTAVPSEFAFQYFEKTQYEERMISDHSNSNYLEWIEYARGNGNNQNWTLYYQSEMNKTQS